MLGHLSLVQCAVHQPLSHSLCCSRINRTHAQTYTQTRPSTKTAHTHIVEFQMLRALSQLRLARSVHRIDGDGEMDAFLRCVVLCPLGTRYTHATNACKCVCSKASSSSSSSWHCHSLWCNCLFLKCTTYTECLLYIICLR